MKFVFVGLVVAVELLDLTVNALYNSHLIRETIGTEVDLSCTKKSPSGESWTYYEFIVGANETYILDFKIDHGKVSNYGVQFPEKKGWFYNQDTRQLTLKSDIYNNSGTYICCSAGSCEIFDVMFTERNEEKDSIIPVLSLETPVGSKAQLEIPVNVEPGITTEWRVANDTCNFEPSNDRFQSCLISPSKSVVGYCMYNKCVVPYVDESVNDLLFTAYVGNNMYTQDFRLKLVVNKNHACHVEDKGRETIIASAAVIGISLLITFCVIINYYIIKNI